jgi:hypothetical protein
MQYNNTIYHHNVGICDYSRNARRNSDGRSSRLRDNVLVLLNQARRMPVIRMEELQGPPGPPDSPGPPGAPGSMANLLLLVVEFTSAGLQGKEVAILLHRHKMIAKSERLSGNYYWYSCERCTQDSSTGNLVFWGKLPIRRF